jgi:hypothetical protein
MKIGLRLLIGLISSVYGPVAGCCEIGIELFGFLKYGEKFDQLSLLLAFQGLFHEVSEVFRS